MVSAISFNGTYKVNNQNPKAYSKFRKFASKLEAEDGVKNIYKDRVNKQENGLEKESTLIVPEYLNSDVETFCANNGIKFTKFNTGDILNPKAVISRIKPAPKGYNTAYINAEKLEKLAKNTYSNIPGCKRDFDIYYRDITDAMIRSGEEIQATTLIIEAMPFFCFCGESSNDVLKRYVEKHGTENLNKSHVSFDFLQKTIEPDHLTYFAIKNLGINKIPVYVSNKSLEAGKILGLFEDTQE